MMPTWARCRSVLLGILPAICLAAGQARAQTLSLPADVTSVMRFRGLRVDTSPLAARGLPLFAERMRVPILLAARQIFSNRLTPNDSRAPTLVVRVDTLQLSSFAGNGGGRHWGNNAGDKDFVEGAGLIVASGGRIIANQPVLVAVPAANSGAWYRPDNEQRRVDAICRQFVSWLQREMGL